MSPRRRKVLLAAGVMLVAAAVTVVLLWGRPGSSATVPDVAQDQPGPVLLVTGYGGGSGGLQVLQEALRRAGRDAVIVPSLEGGTGDLEAQARELDRVAAEQMAAGAPSVDVVGYSAGGVVARIWISRQGGEQVARRVVTLGSPHRGTSLAQLGAVLAPDSCPLACQQLVPNSDLLSGLEQTPAGPVWTSVWTSEDEVITPPESGRLAGAVDLPLQQICADARTSHSELPRDPLVIGLVMRQLGPSALTAVPPAAECAALRTAGAAS